ncbi:MAG TPA: tetratricopeptide repeat protein [Bryobacteraceae bacterium]|jgi:tetratricopeptide (TPR) repeat protein|nr:tetratricopeptide repeat protein [Bryobacteraceae bacterium]
MWILLLLLWANPASFDAALKAGLEALESNNLPAARAKLEEASKIQPQNAKALLGLAQTYWRLALPDMAHAAAARAQAADPENPIVLHGLAYFYSETGEAAKAAPLEARYAEKTPRDPDALPRAANLYLQAGQAQPAIELARQALLQDDRASVHDLLGRAYELQGAPEKAVPEMQAAIRLNRYEEAYYFDLGRLFLRHNNPAAAVQIFEDGRKIFARSAQLELALGVADYSLRRFADAADCFLRTIQLAPEAEQPYVFLGRMLDQVSDKLPQITAAYAGFLKARPDNYLANFLYAKGLSAASVAPQRIEALLRKSIALNAKFWEAHYELALLLERRRDFEAAAGEYLRAIELNSENADLHYHLARVYERLGKKGEASAERAAHERLSSAESAAMRRQQSALTYLDLPSK